MATLTYRAETDSIEGGFEGEGSVELSVAIQCDGTYWATVPADPPPTGGTEWRFRCALPPVANAVVTRVSASIAGGTWIGSAAVRREPLRNGHGLLASDVLVTNHHPFMALPWLALGEGRLTLKGMHLPPEGDPAKLEIEFDPGVAFEVSYARHSPEFREHYWYWPNADRSGLRITIDLGASARTCDPFHFRLHYPEPSYAGGGKRSVEVWMPRDLGAFMDYPTDPSQLDRVQGSSTAAVATVTGYNAFKTLEALFARAGIHASARPDLLDWGCGHGRVTCHFIAGWPQSRVFGSDIDAENVAWCRAHLDAERFSVAPLWPPSGFADAAFDAVIGVSVVTHLTAEAQIAWLAELARLLRPGGIALLTFQDEAHAAYTSRWRDPHWWAHERVRPFDDERREHAITKLIADPGYYRSTTQTAANLIAACEAHFELLWVEEAIFGGYQDCAVLRRR